MIQPINLLAGLLVFILRPVMAETTQEAIRTFEQHTRSNWLHQIDQRAEAITRNPQSVTSQMPAKSQTTMGAHWIHGMADHELSLFQPLEQVQMHTMVIGVPGSGKIRLFDLLVTQAVLRGEPVIIIDPKGDHDPASHTRRSCKLSGQRQRFMKFHPGFPAESIRINLLQNFKCWLFL